MNKKSILILACVAIFAFFLGGAFFSVQFVYKNAGIASESETRTRKDKTGNDKKSERTTANGTSNNFTGNLDTSGC